MAFFPAEAMDFVQQRNERALDFLLSRRGGENSSSNNLQGGQQDFLQGLRELKSAIQCFRDAIRAVSAGAGAGGCRDDPCHAVVEYQMKHSATLPALQSESFSMAFNEKAKLNFYARRAAPSYRNHEEQALLILPVYFGFEVVLETSDPDDPRAPVCCYSQQLGLQAYIHCLFNLTLTLHVRCCTAEEVAVPYVATDKVLLRCAMYYAFIYSNVAAQAMALPTSSSISQGNDVRSSQKHVSRNVMILIMATCTNLIHVYSRLSNVSMMIYWRSVLQEHIVSCSSYTSDNDDAFWYALKTSTAVLIIPPPSGAAMA